MTRSPEPLTLQGQLDKSTLISDPDTEPYQSLDAPRLDTPEPLDAEALVDTLREWLVPMGTEDPIYLRGKQAGLNLAIGIIAERAAILRYDA